MIQNFLTFIRSNTFSYGNNTIIKYFSVSCLSYFLQGISALFIFTLGLNTFFYIIFLSGHGEKKTLRWNMLIAFFLAHVGSDIDLHSSMLLFFTVHSVNFYFRWWCWFVYSAIDITLHKLSPSLKDAWIHFFFYLI